MLGSFDNINVKRSLRTIHFVFCFIFYELLGKFLNQGTFVAKGQDVFRGKLQRTLSESLFIAKISLIKHQLQLKIHVCLENHWSHRIQPGDESELEKNTFWWAGMSELEMSVLVLIKFWNILVIDKEIDQLL